MQDDRNNPGARSHDQALSYFALVVFALFALCPVVYLSAVALQPTNQLMSPAGAVIPENGVFGNFKTLYANTGFLRRLGGSGVVVLALAVATAAVSAALAYTLPRSRRAPGRATANKFLATQALPATMVLLPLYLLLIKLHLINSYIALLLLYAGTVLPSCLWQFRFYYDTIPIAVEEAAAIDGCSRWQTFYRVVLPGAKPVFFATAVFSFIMAWNEYLLGAVLVEDTDLFTLPLGLNLVQANTNLQPGLYAAGALIACVPLIALFLCLSRYAVSVFSSITLKGYTNQ